MIDGKKIDEAAIAFDNKAEWAEDADAQAIVQYSFKKGARWSLQEFKKSLWHDPKEVPEPNRWILVEYMDDKLCYDTIRCTPEDWTATYNYDGNMTKWCYLSDILPKGECGTMKEIKDLQVGDKVVISGLGYPERIAEVERVTKTQVVVNGFRFRRSTGSQCGNNDWGGKTIKVYVTKETEGGEEC